MSPPVLNRQPWSSSLEWMDVYIGIFGSSNDAMKRDAAAARISLWEEKSARVPIAVSLTGLFLKALKVDQERTRSTVELQMLYGAAIVRFVNSYVDLEQNKVYAQSIAQSARDIGIPSEVVDCRHSITHRELPTLELLRHTASICFDFLQTTYWEPQAELVKARLYSVSQSKYLASGLVALLQDLESLAPPDDLESSLERLIDEVSSLSSVHVSVKTLLCAAADVAGLKSKDTARVLKRMGIPEYFCQPAFVSASSWCHRVRKALPKCMEFLESILYQCPHENVTLSFLKDLVLIAYDSEINPPAVLAVLWILGKASPNLAYRLITRIVNSLVSSSALRSSLPTVQLPMGSLTGASDFKCFSSSSPKVSPTLVNSSTAPESGMIRNDGVGGCYCYDYESFSLWLKAMDVSLEEESLIDDLNDTFKYQSRLVNWLRTLLLLPSPSYSSSGIPSSCSSPSSGSPSSSQIPFCLELLLHLFCEPLASPNSPSSSSSSASLGGASIKLGGIPSFTSQSCSTVPSLGNIFCQRLLHCVNIAHGRVMSACRANINTIARVAFKVLFIDALGSSSNNAVSLRASCPPSTSSSSPSAIAVNALVSSPPLTESPSRCLSGTIRSDTTQHRGLKLLLRLFDESDLRIPYSAASRLVGWIANRLLRPTSPSSGADDGGNRRGLLDSSVPPLTTSAYIPNRPQRQAFQRLRLPLHCALLEDRGTSSSNDDDQLPLTARFHAVLIHLLSTGNVALDNSCGGSTNTRSSTPADDKSNCSWSSITHENCANDLELFSPSQAASVQLRLAEIRRKAARTLSASAVQELSTLEIPWTHPGTFPIPQSELPHSSYDASSSSMVFDSSKSIIELLPLNGNTLITPVTDVLRSFTSDVDEGVSPTPPRRGLKRRSPPPVPHPMESELKDTEEREEHVMSLQHLRVTKRPRLASSTDRFIYDSHNGCCVRDDSMSPCATLKFTPIPIQHLESELIRQQQQIFYHQQQQQQQQQQASSSSSLELQKVETEHPPPQQQSQSTDWNYCLMEDWTSLQDMLHAQQESPPAH